MEFHSSHRIKSTTENFCSDAVLQELEKILELELEKIDIEKDDENSFLGDNTSDEFSQTCSMSTPIHQTEYNDPISNINDSVASEVASIGKLDATNESERDSNCENPEYRKNNSKQNMKDNSQNKVPKLDDKDEISTHNPTTEKNELSLDIEVKSKKGSEFYAVWGCNNYDRSSFIPTGFECEPIIPSSYFEKLRKRLWESDWSHDCSCFDDAELLGKLLCVYCSIEKG